MEETFDRETAEQSVETYRFRSGVDAGALYRYHLYSVYLNIQGLLAMLLSAVLVVVCVITWNRAQIPVRILLIAVAAYYPLIKPVTLYLKAKLQANNEAFLKGMEYTATPDGLTISLGEQQVELTWEDVYRIVRREREVYIYTGKLFAYIISREQGGEGLNGMLAMLDRRNNNGD